MAEISAITNRSIIMKIKDKYRELKRQYPDSLILLRSGNFYITYDDDALLLHHLFSYQLLKGKVGFPRQNLEKVYSRLKDERLNYVIFSSDEEIDLYQNQENCYYCYFQRIKKLEFQESMNQMLLDRIRFLLASDSTNYIKIKEFLDEL